MQLSEYITSVQDILHDPNANFYSIDQLTRWINRARHQVAQRGRCVRQLPPTSGSLSSVTVNTGGSGYSVAPTVTISAPDAVRGGVQATAVATVGSGLVTAITVVNAGAGYVATPTVTIDGVGTGAMATAVVTGHVTTQVGQESYDLATIAAIQAARVPGLGDLLGIQSVSVSWGALKPTLQYTDWSTFQAYLRSNNVGYQNYPQFWSMYGQGVSGSFFLWPIPSMVTAMDVDCYFDVQDLSSSQTNDRIVKPWNEPCFYYAAYLAYLNAQRVDDARTMAGEYVRLANEARATVSPDRTPDPYGSWM